MQPIYLFELASQRAEWLSVRQSAVAQNVVNANTPNYKARDVEPFAATLERTALSMRATDPRHIGLADASFRPAEARGSADGTSSEGVSLEKELVKAGEVSRDYSLNVSIVKAFHRMWMASLKG